MIFHSHLASVRLTRYRRLTGAFAALLSTLALLMGTVASAQGSEPLRVVVSLNPYQDLVERVAGGRAQVSTILPPGSSPHAFDPSPSQAAALARADLVIMNGGLDLWLARLVQATAPGTPVLTVLDSVEFTPLEGHDHDGHDHGDEDDREHNHDHDDEHDHAEGFEAINSHIWLDPLIMMQAVDAIAATLTELDPAGANIYSVNAEKLKVDLRRLDDQVTELLAPVAGAAFVPFHDAWVYFAERYHLNIVVTLEPFPGREPSPRYIAESVQAVMASGAKAIFAERQLGSRSAEVVAESAGVAVASLDPLGGTPGPTTYEALLLDNARVILAALAP